MAPGPSNLHPRVVQALGLPLLGHKDPVFLSIMDDRHCCAACSRPATAPPSLCPPLAAAPWTPRSSICSAGDTVVVGRSGFFAERMLGIARRSARGQRRHDRFAVG
jgi:alanine-glyoxylate transaminase/serine-glyoxylate transaminase/serine-pyruvate transaminase